MKLFTITAFEHTMHVYQTYHTTHRRDGEKRTRIKFYTQKKLRNILTTAMRYISEFRNKGPTTISFRNANGRTNALLVALDGNNCIIITALYNTKRSINDVFYGTNHCYLPHYVFTKPTDKELRDEFHLQQEIFKNKEERENDAAQRKIFLERKGTTRKPKWK